MLDGKVSDRGTRLATLTAGLAVGACILNLSGCGVQLPGTISGSNNGPVQLKGITPDSGPIGEETIVLLTGEGFVQGMTVYFGDQIADQVQVINETRATVVVPSENAGVFDVTVQSDLGVATMADGYVNFLLPPEDGTDTDGDGLTDHQEHVGWAVRVDQLGWGLDPGLVGNELLLDFGGLDQSVVVVYTARSDINLVDTDDDGLTDGEEFIVKSDPRTRDTDTDGLWDGEEWFRWLTSPVSVDSDGDARSADPSSAFASLPPNASLFDGAELYEISELLKAPDDRGDIKLNATSPTLEDTDGDNVRDTDEIDTPVRTPLLADMPQLIFEIVDEVDIRLDVEYAEEEGQTTSFETSFTTAESSSLSGSQSNTVSASVTVGIEVGFGPFDFGGGSVEATAGYEHSWESTAESSVSAEQTSSQIEEKSNTNTETAATGSMTAGVKVSNIGNITVQVTDLGFTVRQWQANTDPTDTSPGEYSTFAALNLDVGPGLTLAPGADSGVLLASDEDVNADRIKSFLAQPDSMQIEPAAFELVDSEGFNFAFIEEVTRARTARVSIDFGNGDFEEYRIATNVDRNADGTLAGITMDKVLDLTVGPGNWETQETQPLCIANASNNILINGSFESPVVLGADLSLPPDNWTVTTDPGSDVGLTEVIPAGFPISIPDGNQMLFVLASTSEIASIHQLIGTVSEDPDAVVPYAFAAFASDQGQLFQTDSGYEISLWAGEPGAGGTMLAQEFGDIADTGLTQVQGAFMPLPDPKSKGEDLYLRFGVVVPESQPNPVLHYVDNLIMSGPQNALVRVRDVETQQGLGKSSEFWAVFLSGEQPLGGQPFAETVLRNGDTVLISLTKDNDGDGIFAAQEQQYGSSDDAEDTDGDGLTDPEEVARQYLDQSTCEVLEGGWIVQVTLRDGSVTDEVRVYSDPRTTDSDGDGVDDLQERTDGTNPNAQDTDEDGLTDDVDPMPTVQAGIIYVKEGNGGADGNTWDDAFSSMSTAMILAIARNSDGDDTNDVSQIWVATGEYVLSGATLPTGVQIYGGFVGGEAKLAERVEEGLHNGTSITSGGADSPFFHVFDPLNNTRLDGFAFQNGGPPLVIFVGEESSLVVANCFFFNNTITGSESGGAIISSGVDLTLEDCVFSGNFIDASNPKGGAVWVDNSDSIGSLTIRGCQFVGNFLFASVTGEGGAVYVDGGAVTVEDSIFTANTVQGEGGTGDSMTMQGGAVFLTGGASGTFQNCTFASNEIDNRGGLLDVIWDAGRAGGAVALQDGAMGNFINCEFVGNRASMFGGGIFVSSSATLGVANCTFQGNVAYPDIADNDTLDANRATCESHVFATPIAVGGALGVNGLATIVNSVFWNNDGTDEFSAILCDDQDENCIDFPFYTWTIEQQISTQPSYFPQTFPECLAPSGVIFYNHCAIQDDASSVLSGFFDLGGNFDPVDPGFVGEASGNLRLSSSSLLIDAGNQFVDADATTTGFQTLPDTDFDGDSRIVDGNGDGVEEVDIGAFEFQGGE